MDMTTFVPALGVERQDRCPLAVPDAELAQRTGHPGDRSTDSRSVHGGSTSESPSAEDRALRGSPDPVCPRNGLEQGDLTDAVATDHPAGGARCTDHEDGSEHPGGYG
jgi:hypothetical protein